MILKELTLPPIYADADIVIVDDQPSNLNLLSRILERAGYQRVRSTTQPREALELCAARLPDVILLDLHMPEMNGVEFINQLRQLTGRALPQILVLTGDASQEAKRFALATGARDFLPKPYDAAEVLLRLHNLIDLRMLQHELEQRNLQLERRVEERTRELDQARLEVIERLGRAAELRDDATGQHTRRVGVAAARLAEAAGQSAAEVEVILRAAPLHDVGKIAIPDHVLLKPGPLTAAEWEIMRSHSEIGARLLSGGRSPLLDTAQQIALTHHERWDGGGYPHGLAGPAIPLAGRIVALADVFDALTHDRPYRPRRSAAEVAAILERGAGTHFDPTLTSQFLELLRQGDPTTV